MSFYMVSVNGVGHYYNVFDVLVVVGFIVATTVFLTKVSRRW